MRESRGRPLTEPRLSSKVLLKLFVIALCIRLVFMAALALRYGMSGPQFIRTSDGYYELAVGMATRHTFAIPGRNEPVLHRGPLYPLALFVARAPHFKPAAALLNIFFGALLCLLVQLIASAHFRARSLVPFWVAAFNPHLIWWTRKAATQLLGAVLVAAAFLYILNALKPQRGRLRDCILAGVLIGGAILTHGSLLILALVPLITLLAFGRRRPGGEPRQPRAGRLGRAAVILTVAAICVAPWGVRNSALAGGPVLYNGVGTQYWFGVAILSGQQPETVINATLKRLELAPAFSRYYPAFSSLPLRSDRMLAQAGARDFARRFPRSLVERLEAVGLVWGSSDYRDLLGYGFGAVNAALVGLMLWSAPWRRSREATIDALVYIALQTAPFALLSAATPHAGYSVYMSPLLAAMLERTRRGGSHPQESRTLADPKRRTGNDVKQT